jgi:tryptophan-rich sensory protein
LQLGLNFSWSWLFFWLRSPGIALLDLLLLSACLIGTLVTFRKHTILGACLLLPYFAWIMYAIYLNLYIWIYNWWAKF